jgi:hypothetical protein
VESVQDPFNQSKALLTRVMRFCSSGATLIKFDVFLFAPVAKQGWSLFVSARMHHVAFDFLKREITNWQDHYQWHQQANMHILTHFGPHLCHIRAAASAPSPLLCTHIPAQCRTEAGDGCV